MHVPRHTYCEALVNVQTQISYGIYRPLVI